MGNDEDIDRLYALPLSEFTAARNTVAKELGGEEGKRVKALRKPSAAAWALNQAVRSRPELLNEFLESATALREAHEALLDGGERDALEEATRRERAAAGALADEAARAADGNVHEKVLGTLRAALGDDEVREELEAGRLVRGGEAVGLGPFGTAPPRGRKREPAKAERNRAARAELKQARQRAGEAARRARDAGQKVA